MGDNWKSLAKAWSKNFCVHLIDQRNHGRSFWSHSFDYNVMAQDLLTTDYAKSVSTRSDGFYQVDYSQLDVTFKKV